MIEIITPENSSLSSSRSTLLCRRRYYDLEKSCCGCGPLRRDHSIASREIHPDFHTSRIITDLNKPFWLQPRVETSTSQAPQTSIPLLTIGQTFTPTSTAVETGTKTHGFGGLTDLPTTTATFIPLVWNTILFANVSEPVLPPGSAPTTVVSKRLSLSLIPEPTILANADTIKERALPASVDWRNRGGLNYLATVQNQDPCGSCWIFSATALMETQVRIEHGLWSKRSEGDLMDQMGVRYAVSPLSQSLSSPANHPSIMLVADKVVAQTMLSTGL
jgi:hypothetical protein